MTNVSLLTPEQERCLLDGYTTLTGLAETCRVPSVSAALRGALAELRVALDGQGVELEDYYRPAGAATKV
ncbi:DUF6052 family protein [Streptomyces wedmorensis]|uniref:DUF6052 family protein n=1 Tax=Streptomyces wedmorensis TaxID=43759 RepID=UPI0034173C08